MAIPSEHSEQVELVRRLRRSGVLFCAVPNGGKRAGVEAAKLVKEGVSAGVPDLLVFDGPGGAVLTAYERDLVEGLRGLSLARRRAVASAAGIAAGVGLEMKRDGAGTVSAKQETWLGALAERGWDTMVGWGWRDALAKLRKGGYDVR